MTDTRNETEIVDQARQIESDDLEIDDFPVILRAENGSWVQAWIWVPATKES